MNMNKARELLKTLKHDPKSYPKDTREFNKEIEYYTTISPETELASKFW